MKKLTIAMLIVSVAALVFASAAFAQVDTPLNPGRGGGRGATNPGNTGNQTLDGILHNYLVDYYAVLFGMDAATLDARMLAGESVIDIAVSLGYTVDEAAALMDVAREVALSNALADGFITKDQYDLMIDAGTAMVDNTYSNSYAGSSQSNGRGSRSQSGSNMNSNTGTGLNLQDGSCLP